MCPFFTPSALRGDGGGRISPRGDVQRPFERDRLAGLRVVVEGLAERDPEREHEEHERNADAPAAQLFAPAVPAALAALDRGQGHGM